MRDADVFGDEASIFGDEVDGLDGTFRRPHREIRLASGRGVSHLTEDAVVLDDGAVLPADLVVSAAGYGPMTDWAAQSISPEVAERVGPCWGLGSGTARDPGPRHGELRNM